MATIADSRTHDFLWLTSRTATIQRSKISESYLPLIVVRHEYASTANVLPVADNGRLRIPGATVRRLAGELASVPRTGNAPKVPLNKPRIRRSANPAGLEAPLYGRQDACHHKSWRREGWPVDSGRDRVDGLWVRELAERREGAAQGWR